MALRNVLVLLVVSATAMFVVGTTIEREEHSEADSHHIESAEGEVHSEAGESEPGHAESEEILGGSLESTPLVILAAITALLLAAAAWARPKNRGLLLVVALAMLAFAALDVREVVHQLEEEGTNVAIIAAVVAAFHLLAAACALKMRRTAQAT